MNKNEFKLLFPDWKTPNTYDCDFGEPPQRSGVYLLVRTEDYVILYIGSAKFLFQRYERHEVRRVLQEVYGHIQFYWNEYDDYRFVEKGLIKQHQPKFNKQWR